MTVIPFQPANSSPPFQTVVTLDGANYALTVTWNVYGQRWYVTIMDDNGNIMWNGAMVGSPLTSSIFLAPGIFTSSTILFREDTGNFEVNP